MIRRPPGSTRTDTLCRSTTLFRSRSSAQARIDPVKALRGFRLDTRHNFSPPVLKVEHTVPRWALHLQTLRISEQGIMTGQQVARIIAGHGYAPFGRAGLPPLMPTARDGQPKQIGRAHV